MADVPQNWFRGAAASTMWSMPELFGFEAPKSVVRWRYDNPIAGFGTSMLGSTVPYMGWYSGAKRIAKLENWLQKAASARYLKDRPFQAGAFQEAVRFMPLELSRIGVNQAFGSQSTGEMISSAAMNTALSGAVGGLIGGIKGGGLKERLPDELLPDINTLDPPQLQLRGIAVKLGQPDAVRPEDMFAVEARQQDLRRLVRGEEAVPHEYIGELQGGNDRKRLNNLFNASRGPKGGPGSDVYNRKFLADKRGGHFTTDTEWQDALGIDFGINPVQFEHWAQYPRLVGAKNAAGSLKLQLAVGNGMNDIGQGWHMSQEVDDGLWVMAKERQNPKPQAEREYVMFKTDSPDIFIQNHAQAGSRTVAVNAWAKLDPALQLPGGKINTEIVNHIERLPMRNWRFGIIGGRNWAYDVTKQLLGYAGVKTTPSQYAFVANVSQQMRKYFAPGMFQLKGKVRATYIDGMNRLAVDYAKSVANEMLHGKVKGPQGSSLLHQVMTYSNRVRGNGIADKILYDLDEKDIADIWKVYKDEVPVTDLPRLTAKYGISKKAQDALTEMYDIAGKLDTDSVLLNRKYGGTGFRAKDNHVMLRKEWPHDMLIEVRNKNNQLVGLANENGTKATESIAAKMIKDAAANGDQWHAGARYRRSTGQALPPEIKNIIDSGIPGHWLKRTQVKGHKFDETPFTKQELADEFSRAVHARTQQHAGITIENEMKGELNKLQLDDPHSLDIVSERWNDLQYKPRNLDTQINQMADRLLAPLIGPNSATRIVGATNKAMWHLELGGARMGYILLNALTPIQTVLPHVAMLINAKPHILGDYYTYFAAMGTQGPVGTVGVLTPLKLMKETIKSMARPDTEMQEAFNWAMQNGVIAPRMIEDFIGQNANLPQKLGSYFKDRDIVGAMAHLSEYLPGQSEKFSRAFSFAAGMHTGKLMGIIEPEHLRDFAKRFTERTNYLYSQADRAGIMTGPVGGTLGLFKNWMFHYMGNMAEYGGEAMRGNMAPLLWQTAGTFGLGGLAATPVLYPAAQGLSSLLTDKPLQENMYSMLNEEAADGLLFGLPAALFGVALTAQAASPLSNPMRDANSMMTLVHADRMKYFANAFGAAFDYYELTGNHPGDNNEVLRNLVRATMPKSIFRTMQVAMDDTLESWATGYQIMDPKKFGMMDQLLFAAGFSPTEVERQYMSTSILYKDQQTRRALTAAAGKAIVDAREVRDYREIWNIIQGAKYQGLDLSSVFKSAATRDRSGNMNSVTRTFSPQEQAKVRHLMDY